MVTEPLMIKEHSIVSKEPTPLMLTSVFQDLRLIDMKVFKFAVTFRIALNQQSLGFCHDQNQMLFSKAKSCRIREVSGHSSAGGGHHAKTSWWCFRAHRGLNPLGGNPFFRWRKEHPWIHTLSSVWGTPGVLNCNSEDKLFRASHLTGFGGAGKMGPGQWWC